MMDERAAADLKVRLADTPVRVAAGMEGLLEAAELPSADTVLTAVVGMIGLRPTMTAIRAGKRIALANKETLVCAGELVQEEARDFGAEILPVDSEHSALFQSLQGCRDRREVKRLILTCSGGPFFGKTRAELAHVTRKDALRHPNWSMGAKITIDSATLMNKGLEFIEAMHLYQMPPEKISIVIHRESIIHSLVEYCDNAVIAQLGAPDMRLPIQYALTWPPPDSGTGRAAGPVRLRGADLRSAGPGDLPVSGPGPEGGPRRGHRRRHSQRRQRGRGGPVPGGQNRLPGHRGPGGAGHGAGEAHPESLYDPDFGGGPGGQRGRAGRLRTGRSYALYYSCAFDVRTAHRGP